jgi:hypothetical protein
VGKFSEIDSQARRSKRTDKTPAASAAEALIRELQNGATIDDVLPRPDGAVVVRLRNAKGITYHVRLPAGLGELTPDQLGIYAKALAGQSVVRPGRPSTVEERDAQFRASAVLYWAQGHPLKPTGDANKKSAFELTADDANAAGTTTTKGKPITPELVEKAWEKGSAKDDLKALVKPGPP